MRFKIVGANAETGDDVDVLLEAPSQGDVERIAHDKGILVSLITPMQAGRRHSPHMLPMASHAPRLRSCPCPAHAPAHAPAHQLLRMHRHTPQAMHRHMPPRASRLPHRLLTAAHHARQKNEDLSAISLIDDEPVDPVPPKANAPRHDHRQRQFPFRDGPYRRRPYRPGQAFETPMEYHVILNQSLFLLESAVNRHLREGWEPSGGLSVGMSNNALQFFQAMTRRKKVDAPKAEAVHADGHATEARRPTRHR